MYSLHFSSVEIESVLKSVKTGKATGPDEMNNRILRELSKELAVPFCSHFNQSIETGVFPQCWKVQRSSRMSDIQKRRSLTSVKLPPCTVLCTPAKVMERVVFKHLYNHFYDNDIIMPLPSGFIPGDSITNQ